MEKQKTGTVIRINVHINSLLLDPNNYRFVKMPGFTPVEETYKNICEAQKNTLASIAGKNNELIGDLLKNFKEKGFLRDNNIQVKKLTGEPDNKTYYLVLEGSRRVGALKLLYRELNRELTVKHGENGEAGLLNKADFENIPVILHTDEPGDIPGFPGNYLRELEELRNKLYRVSSGFSLEKLLLQNQKGSISPQTESAPLLSDPSGGPFKEIYIKDYRKIKKLKIEHLNRINIIAGKNNSGKTTLLEAVYLISQLNHSTSFLELERCRGKFAGSFNPKWLDLNMKGPYCFQADFGGKKIKLTLKKEQTTAQIDKTAYLSSITAEAFVNEHKLESSIHLFSNREPEIYYEKKASLCRAAFTSPYRYNEALLQRAHSLAVQNKFIDEIIGFIRDYIDPSISRIDMVNIEGVSRFYVHSAHFSESIDITKYGEGVQRIFEIALLFAYCKEGILCIDEFESAIHKSLLIRFSRFIQQLAERFDVQVFLSTHSKECIDAFINNEYKNEDLTAYSLRELENGGVDYRYVKGPRLESLIDSINVDLRG